MFLHVIPFCTYLHVYKIHNRQQVTKFHHWNMKFMNDITENIILNQQNQEKKLESKEKKKVTTILRRFGQIEVTK